MTLKFVIISVAAPGGTRGGKCPPKLFSAPHFAPMGEPWESHGCRNHTGRGATKIGQMLLKHLSWVGKIVKIYEMLLKIFTFLVGLGKIFGRSVKNFGRPGQFLKVWKKN